MRSLSVLAVSVAGLSCTHTVLRPTPCPKHVEPSGRSAIAWEHVAGKKGLFGTVMWASTLKPLVAANVHVTILTNTEASPPKTFATISDSLGLAVIDSLRPGKYHLAVRRIGFYPATDTVSVVPDSGLTFRGLMAIQQITLDECGLMLYEKRVPWWIRK